MIRLALKNLLRSQRIVILLILNLSLGFSGFVAVESFKNSLEKQIQENSKNLLTADLAFSARRGLTDSEIQSVDVILGDAVKTSMLFDFYAMMNVGSQSRLVLVKAIDDNYPLYGEIELKDGKIIRSEDSKQDLLDDGIYIYPELENEFDLKLGQEVGLGKLSLQVTGVIAKDSSQSFRAAGLAPRVFIHESLLKHSGLIQFGSTFTQNYLFRFTDFPLQPEEEKRILEDYQGEIYKSLPDPGIRVETPASAGEDSGRQLNYLTDFLGLVALVSLFLSALGAIFLIRLDLQRRLKEFAIFKSLGMGPAQFFQFYFTYFLLVGIITCIPTTAFSWVVIEVVSGLIKNLSSFDLVVVYSFNALLISFAFSIVGTFLICLPQIFQVQKVKASVLFAEGQFQQHLQAKNGLWYLPLVFVFVLLSFYQAKSYLITALFLAALVGSFLVLGAAGYLLFFVLLKRIKFKAWNLKYSMKSLLRRKFSSLAIFVSLGLGAVLLNILPQLKASLLNEFEVDGMSKVPSLFMFDIQEDQMSGIEKLAKDKGLNLLAVSPLIRTRIITVNNEEFERSLPEDRTLTREEEAEVRFRNRGANISIRQELSDSETLVDGVPFTGPYDFEKNEIAELSIEERYAGRLNLAIGDILEFDVQGVQFKGKVVNFRKVKWTSFQPNFFIIIQEGLLEDAPKTFIAALPQINSELRSEIQKDIVSQYPNVSVIDVERLVKEVLKVADQMSWSLQFMSILSLLLGYTILFSMIRSQVEERKWEMNLMKILGAKPSVLHVYLSFEYLLLSLGAAVTGSLLSVGVCYGISLYVFENLYSFEFFWPLMTTLLVVSLTLILCWALARKVMLEKPLGILNDR